MKRIIVSLSIIGAVAAVAIGGTVAFFSDTETSTGNTFTAGAIDLKIDNECHYWWNGQLIQCPNGPEGNGYWTSSWSEDDLGRIHKFFNFGDIKPGDWGEDTISIHVVDNDAWGSWGMTNTTDSEGTCTEPETEAQAEGNHPCVANTTPGQLGAHMKGRAWLDQGGKLGFQCAGRPRCEIDPLEGDNLWQPNSEPVIAQNINENETGFRSGSFFDVFTELSLEKPLSSARLAAGEACDATDPDGDGHTAPIGETYLACHGLARDGRLVGSTTYYIGWMWSLDGQSTGNDVQTDTLGADMTFKAEQHRNNPLRPV